MKNALQIGILLSIFSSLSACGTFIGRSEPRPVEGEYYNSTKGDLLLLGAVAGAECNTVIELTQEHHIA